MKEQHYCRTDITGLYSTITKPSYIIEFKSQMPRHEFGELWEQINILMLKARKVYII